jgi:signal peptidase I
MTIQPETVPPASNGSNGSSHAPVVDPVVARSPAPTAPRAKRTSDYRLRGLDLDAPALAEVPVRAARRSHPSRRRRRRRLTVQWLVALTVVALTAALVRATVVQPFTVTSASMVPTLQPGTDVLVVKPRVLTSGIDAGDIVVLEQPAGSDCGVPGESRHLVSRVIGLPGQTIWSEDDSIYVDGERLDEPGWHNPPFGEIGTTPIARTEVPSGSYFVLGDNRTDTCDSRAFGPVGESLLVGEVVATTARGGHPYVHMI